MFFPVFVAPRYRPPSRDAWDYIVVGGGAAGCVMAAALAADGRFSVLLVEEGRRDVNPWIHVPATFFKVLQSRDAQVIASPSEAGLDGGPMPIPQGRVLGGGSSVNAMCYVRGQPADYDGWAEMGARGWAWADVLPVFKAQEANRRLGEPWHGQHGPLAVGDAMHRHPACEAFVAAAVDAGFPANDDFNDGQRQEGVGFYQVTAVDGRRRSAATSFLAPLARADTLELATGWQVGRVRFAGRRAVAVEARDAGGQARVFRARREIVLTAGALATPKLLMLSGIGPAAELARHGIDCIADVPEVGTNFQDHVATVCAVRFRRPIGLHGHDRGLRALRHGLHYVLGGGGVLASNVIEAGGFLDTRESGVPDVQLNVAAMVPDVPGKGLRPIHGMHVNPLVLRPASRGRVALRSANPADPIRLDAGSLADARDVEVLRRAIAIARAIFARPALRDLFAAEIEPGPDVGRRPGDPALDAAIRRNARTVYHPCGTCRMGGDARAVVDPALRVRGVDGLRVADASVMPALVSGNTNAPTMMIAGKGAAMMLADVGKAG